MDDNFILRSGKYAGKTIGWLKQNNSNYLTWVKENQPNMLKPNVKVEPKKIVENEMIRDGKIQPNLNFDNEGPVPILKLKNKNNFDN
jgi:hypothetical protein